jgi:hypothetical protein
MFYNLLDIFLGFILKFYTFLLYVYYTFIQVYTAHDSQCKRYLYHTLGVYLQYVVT